MVHFLLLMSFALDFYLYFFFCATISHFFSHLFLCRCCYSVMIFFLCFCLHNNVIWCPHRSTFMHFSVLSTLRMMKHLHSMYVCIVRMVKYERNAIKITSNQQQIFTRKFVTIREMPLSNRSRKIHRNNIIGIGEKQRKNCPSTM